MAQLIFITGSSREQSHILTKRMTTVGTEPTHDIVVQAQPPGIIFTLTEQDGEIRLLPNRKVRLNGESLNKAARLRSCDRIEWDSGTAILSQGVTVTPKPTSDRIEAAQALGILQNLASTLHATGSVQIALYQLLDALVELANAEIGYVLSESREGSGWDMIAARQKQDGDFAPAPDRKQIFSNTIVTEALEKREPVYVESIVGHPWADAHSVIAARIFSAACFPLCVGDRVLGAAFLFTRSPGKPIRKESLTELTLLATQAALMLASQSELKSVRRENRQLLSLVPHGNSGLLFEAASPMQDVLRKIQKLGPTPLSVLIQGETGTGKEVVARELHATSEHAKSPFIAVNCAAIPATLLESTLFGYERGAFTGATRAQDGKFQQANGGTLFLDEIGDLSLDLQSKLLRVLQEKQVEPLGGRPVSIEVRIIAATHRDLDSAVREGTFRQDLYYRLNGSTIRLPALRDRPDDIPLLARHFLRKTGAHKELAADAIRTLREHAWPGNVRELEQVMTRAAFLSEGDEIRREDLELQPAQDLWKSTGEFASLEDAQLAFTRDFVKQALAKTGDNRSQAAAKLGISERTLYRILSDSSGRLT